MKVLFLFFTDPPRPFSSSVAQLAAVVRAAGHTPDALEISCKGSVAPAASEIVRRAPDVLAVSAMSRDWPGASAVLTRARRERDFYTVVGGYHATFAPHDVAACDAVDAICIGEGELPLRALLETRARGERPSTGAGLWARTPRGWDEPLPSSAVEPDIAALPLWDYDVFGDVGALLGAGINTFGPAVDRFLPVRASRGCPFTCAYCSAPGWAEVNGIGSAGRRDVRPVEHLVAELATLRDRYAPAGFEFWDEHFPVSIPWLEELAAVYPTKVGIPFKVEMHPRAASRRRLELLARAGCVLFHCGVEAGDETLRRSVLSRRVKDEELERVFADCRELGLATSASAMTMLPGETRAQMISTTALLAKLRPGSFMWSTYQPLPGTPLGRAAVSEWPSPALERLDDHAPLVSHTPPAVTDAEREATYRELAALQAGYVDTARAASGGRARPIDVPTPVGAPPPTLVALLAPAEETIEISSAVAQRGTIVLELRAGSEPSVTVTLAANDGSRFFCASERIGVSYRGKSAPPAALAAMRRMVDRVGALDIDALIAHFRSS